ncbi:phospholipase A2-like protein Y52B11A.8 [Ditylenchus destructor]|nr:phospholipase A2-like protein Y52B11A.8 [Ditylenchus destructor]
MVVNVFGAAMLLLVALYHKVHGSQSKNGSFTEGVDSNTDTFHILENDIPALKPKTTEALKYSICSPLSTAFHNITMTDQDRNSSLTTSAALNNISDPRRGGDSDYDLTPSVPLDDQWSCGADEFSLYVAEATVERDCPINKNRINKCCIAHDKCYDDQLGQKHCDDVFCECLVIATEQSEVCSKETGPAFCNLVREFGADPYADSGPKQKNPSSPAPQN